MRAGGAPPLDARVRRIEFTAHALVMHLEDGRWLGVPLAWFPRLLEAAPKARQRWERLDGRSSIHWPDLDEDLSVPGLLGLPD